MSDDAVSMRDYVDRIVRDHEHRDFERHDAMQRAFSRLEEDVVRRFSASNEWREQLDSQTQSFVSRNEWGTAHGQLLDRVSDLAGRLERIEGRSAGIGAYNSTIFALVATVAAVIAVFVRLR